VTPAVAADPPRPDTGQDNISNHRYETKVRLTEVGLSGAESGAPYPGELAATAFAQRAGVSP
jgi:hypothetical protein